MPLPGMSARPEPSVAARVRVWARSAAGDDDRTIVVSELACTEPGCPPLETVIGLLAPGRQTQFKVHKPLAEVTEADVIAAFARGDHDHTEEPR